MPRTRDQARVYMKRRYQQRRAHALAALGGKCARCGSEIDLQIDHVDPEKKEMGFARMTHVGMPRFLVELAKCQLLCGECHQRKTTEEDMGQERRQHGNYTMYRHGKCRCDLCREANRQYSRDQRAASLGGGT